MEPFIINDLWLCVLVGSIRMYNARTKCNHGNVVKGTQMGPLLVFVSPCFRENVKVTCKIVSFLSSLDHFLLKNAIVLFLEIKFQNGAHLKEGLFLTYFSHF